MSGSVGKRLQQPASWQHHATDHLRPGGGSLHAPVGPPRGGGSPRTLLRTGSPAPRGGGKSSVAAPAGQSPLSRLSAQSPRGAGGDLRAPMSGSTRAPVVTRRVTPPMVAGACDDLSQQQMSLRWASPPPPPPPQSLAAAVQAAAARAAGLDEVRTAWAIASLEARVDPLAQRSEQLTHRAAQVKDRLLREGVGMAAEERSALLDEADQLLADTEHLAGSQSTSGGGSGASSPAKVQREHSGGPPAFALAADMHRPEPFSPERPPPVSGRRFTAGWSTPKRSIATPPCGGSTASLELRAECAAMRLERVELAEQRRCRSSATSATSSRVGETREGAHYATPSQLERELMSEIGSLRRQCHGHEQKAEKVEQMSREHQYLTEQVASLLQERTEERRGRDAELQEVKDRSTELLQANAKLRFERQQVQDKQDRRLAESRNFAEDLAVLRAQHSEQQDALYAAQQAQHRAEQAELCSRREVQAAHEEAQLAREEAQVAREDARLGREQAQVFREEAKAEREQMQAERDIAQVQLDRQVSCSWAADVSPVAHAAAPTREESLSPWSGTCSNGFSLGRFSGAPRQASPVADETCSMSRLRRVITDQSSSTQDLRNAIEAADAFVAEARRELSNRELREKRAAHEALHDALVGATSRCDAEATLELAVERARRAEVEDEDVERAETKLAELHAMTDEQRSSKAARILETERKKQAFMLVKRDDAEGFQDFLGSLEPEVAWPEWKDYAGRTLWRCSQDLRSARVQQCLRSLLGMDGEERRVASQETSTARPCCVETPCVREPPEEWSASHTSSLALSMSNIATADMSVSCPSPCVTKKAMTSIEEPVSSESKTTEPVPAQKSDEAEMKARALRAVVKDDPTTLAEVIQLVPVDSWSQWRNKAGTDLITLSEERGSSLAYSVLATALGIVKEMPRESFEERETVWVFAPGDVQPRRATVIEDTSEDSESVLLEFWDGSGAPESADICMVRKMA